MFGQTEVVKELLNHTVNIEVKARSATPLFFGIFLNIFIFFDKSCYFNFKLQNMVILKLLKNYLIVMLILKRKMKADVLHLLRAYFLIIYSVFK